MALAVPSKPHKHWGFTGCGKTPNGRRKSEIWGMQNHRPTLTDRSWVILARFIFRAFLKIEFFRSLFSP